MTKKLTVKEIKWLERVQRALDACPSDRMGFYTIGDQEITIYDLGKQDAIDEVMDAGQDFCIGVDKYDAELGNLRFPSNVHSTAG